MNTTPIRWGILSTARIGTDKVIPAMRQAQAEGAPLCITAIASRQMVSAQVVAQQLGIPTAHGSYEALLADPNVDVIYNPLPNHLHVPLTLAAAQAGKHVLCEKPFALRAQDLEALRPWASRVHIQEAFMVRHHPQWVAVREALRNGVIGDLRFAQMPFSYFNADPGNIRNQADIGGGALMDIGCYAIAAARWFFEEEPTRVMACIDRDPTFHTDRTASGMFAFSGGRQMTFTVSTQALRFQRLQLVGTQGRIEIEIPVNAPLAPLGGSTRYFIDRQGDVHGAGIETITVPPCNMYALQAVAFSRQVRESAPSARDLDDAVAQMQVLDALLASEASGRWEVPQRGPTDGSTS